MRPWRRVIKANVHHAAHILQGFPAGVEIENGGHEFVRYMRADICTDDVIYTKLLIKSYTVS
jgi:hypothetical protein